MLRQYDVSRIPDQIYDALARTAPLIMSLDKSSSARDQLGRITVPANVWDVPIHFFPVGRPSAQQLK
jgi:hypothetical protein